MGDEVGCLLWRLVVEVSCGGSLLSLVDGRVGNEYTGRLACLYRGLKDVRRRVIDASDRCE